MITVKIDNSLAGIVIADEHQSITGAVIELQFIESLFFPALLFFKDSRVNSLLLFLNERGFLPRFEEV